MSCKTTILIIGHDSELCNHHARSLSRHGYHVICTPSKDTGIDMVQKKPAELVLLNLHPSILEKSDILEQITQKLRNIPILVVSRNSYAQQIIKLLRMGAWDVLCPPFTQEALSMAVIKALNRTTVLFPDHVGIKAANHIIHFSTKNTPKKNSSQTLEYPGNIAGCIAHDFNNILGTIVCSSELLLGTCQATSPPHEDIQRILQACMRGKELVAQILCYACNRPVQKSPIDLAQLINELLPLLQATIPTHITINKKFDAHHCVISGNYAQIQQIIVNLITNAVYALRTVTDPVLDIRLTNNGERLARIENSSSKIMSVVLSITDNGEGIDQESISRIFTPFFTTKQNGEGTGLGLSIVAKIVQEHQASLSLRSNKNSGTSFQVRFPIIHDYTPILSPQKNITEPNPV